MERLFTYCVCIAAGITMSCDAAEEKKPSKKQRLSASISVVGAHSTISARSEEEEEPLSIMLSQESDSSASSSAASSALGTPELTASGLPTGELTRPFAQFSFALPLAAQSKKKEIEKRDSDGETPLMTAAFEGNLDQVKKLLDAKAEVNAQDFDGKTALYFAILGVGIPAKAPRIAVIEALLKAKTDVNLKDGDMSLLALAKQTGNKTVIEMLQKS